MLAGRGRALAAPRAERGRRRSGGRPGRRGGLGGRRRPRPGRGGLPPRLRPLPGLCRSPGGAPRARARR